MLIFLFLLLLCSRADATLISYPTTWGVNDTVTNVKLNNNNSAVSNVVNGSLDNTNMASGYFLYQSVSSLPAAGTQGRVDFLTSDNSINLDNGSAWLKTITPTGTLATGQIPLYNSSWGLLSPGAQYYSIVSNGVSSLPSYQQVNLANGVTSTLPIANGGTGQTTAQTAIDALLPSQSGKSGKVITTNGTASSWGDSSWSLVSSTSVSAVTTTGSISITSGNTYMVVFNLETFSGATQLELRFNGDGGANYDYINTGSTTTGAITNNLTGDTAMFIAKSVKNNGTSGITGRFMVMQKGAASQVYHVWGDCAFEDNTSNLFANMNFAGRWSGSATATSFALLTTGNTFTGTVQLYKLSTS